MSKYTTEVRFICENYAGLTESVGFDGIDEVIETVLNNDDPTKQIFGEYPIFDEEYRNVLNTHILKHYYTREICAETVGLWKLWLNNRMNEIMPRYNKLYETELLEFNPLYTVDLSTTHSREGSTTGNQESDISDTRATNRNSDENIEHNKVSESSSNENRKSDSSTLSESATDNRQDNELTRGSLDKYADTPQGEIENLTDGTYLTNARQIDESAEGTTKETGFESNTKSSSEKDETNINGSNITTGKEGRRFDESANEIHSGKRKTENKISNAETYLERVVGKTAGQSYSKLIQEYRDTFLNIDMMIINDLSDLFFGLWE